MDTQIFVILCLILGFVYRFILDDLEYKEIVFHNDCEIEVMNCE